MEGALASVTAQRDARVAQRDRLQGDVAASQKAIGQRLDAQRAHTAHLDAQARFNEPELDFWTDFLCLRIDGICKDQLRFVYWNVGERQQEEEVWFDLCTEKRDYQVLECKPKLDLDSIERCVERLNENRDLGRFLKSMRDLFVEVMEH